MRRDSAVMYRNPLLWVVVQKLRVSVGQYPDRLGICPQVLPNPLRVAYLLKVNQWYSSNQGIGHQ